MFDNELSDPNWCSMCGLPWDVCRGDCVEPEYDFEVVDDRVCYVCGEVCEECGCEYDLDWE